MLSSDAELWRQLHDRLEQTREDVAARVLRGHCPDWADYKRCVGYIQAIDDTIANARDLLGRMRGEIPEEEPEQEED